MRRDRGDGLARRTSPRNRVSVRYLTDLVAGVEGAVLATTNAYTKKDAKAAFETALKRKIKLSEIDRD